MNILLIEDDHNKIKQIVDFLFITYPEINITKKFSYQTGLKEIINNKQKYKLSLLDMSMPTFDISTSETGGRLRPYAGKDILRQMLRKNIIIPTIVVTQFENFGETLELDQLNSELKNNFPDTYKGTVYYSAAQNNWKEELLMLVESLLRRI